MSKRACADYPHCLTPNSVVFYRDVSSLQGWSGGLVASEMTSPSGTIEVVPMKFVGNTAALLENFRSAPKRAWAHFHNSSYTFAVEGSKPPSRKLSLAAGSTLPDFRLPAVAAAVGGGVADTASNASQGTNHRVRKSLATSKRSAAGGGGGGGAPRPRRAQFVEGAVPRGQEEAPPQGGKGNFIDEVETSLCPSEQFRKVQVLEGLRRHLRGDSMNKELASPFTLSGSPGASPRARQTAGLVTSYYESLADVLVFQHPLKRPTRPSTVTAVPIDALSIAAEAEVADALANDERRPVRLKLVAFTSILLANVPTTTVKVPLSYVSNAPIPSAPPTSGVAVDGRGPRGASVSSARVSMSPQLPPSPAAHSHVSYLIGPLGGDRGLSGATAIAAPFSPTTPSDGISEEQASSTNIRVPMHNHSTFVSNAATTAAAAVPLLNAQTATASVSPASTLEDGRSSGVGTAKAVSTLSPSPPPREKANVSAAPSFTPNATTLVPSAAGRRGTGTSSSSYRHRGMATIPSVLVPAANPTGGAAADVSPLASTAPVPQQAAVRKETSPPNRSGSVAPPPTTTGNASSPSWNPTPGGTSLPAVPVAEYHAVDAAVLEILPALLHTQHVAEEAVLNGDVNRPPVAEFHRGNGWLTIPRLTDASLTHALDLTQMAEGNKSHVHGVVAAFFPCDVSDELFEGLSTCLATTWVQLQSFSLSMVQHAFLSPSAMELSFEIKKHRTGSSNPAELEKHDHVLAQDAIPVISKIGIAHIVAAVGFRWSQSPFREHVGPTVVEVNPPLNRVPLAFLKPAEVLFLTPRASLAPLVHVELSFLKLEDSDLRSNKEALFFESLDGALPWLQTLSLRGNFLSDNTACKIAQLLASDVDDRVRRWRVLQSHERRAKRSMQRLSASSADTNITTFDAEVAGGPLHRARVSDARADPGAAAAAKIAKDGPSGGRDVPALRRLDLSLNRIGDDGAFALAQALFDGRAAPFLSYLSLEGNTVTKAVKDDVLEALIVPSNAPAWSVARHGRCERSVRRRVLVMAFCLLRCRDRAAVESAATWTDLCCSNSFRGGGGSFSRSASPSISPRRSADALEAAVTTGRQVDESRLSPVGAAALGSSRRQSLRDAFAAFGSVQLFDCDGQEEQATAAGGGQERQQPLQLPSSSDARRPMSSSAPSPLEWPGPQRTSIAFPFLTFSRDDDASCLSGSRGAAGDGGLSPTHQGDPAAKARKRSRVSIVEVALPVAVGDAGAPTSAPGEWRSDSLGLVSPSPPQQQQTLGDTASLVGGDVPKREGAVPPLAVAADTATNHVRRLSLDELSYVARQHRERLQAAERRREHEDRESLIESVAAFFSMYERRLPLAVLF